MVSDAPYWGSGLLKDQISVGRYKVFLCTVFNENNNATKPKKLINYSQGILFIKFKKKCF